MHIVV